MTLCNTDMISMDGMTDNIKKIKKENRKQKENLQTESTYQTNYLSFSEVLFDVLLHRLLTKLNYSDK